MRTCLVCQRRGHAVGAKLLAAIEASKKAPLVVLVPLIASAVGALAQFTGATKTLIALVHPAKADPRAELAKLGIAFTPEAMAKAAADGDARAVELLLDAGMPVDTATDAALPPLMLAAQSGSVATAARLIAAGADPGKPTAAGSPLAYAVHYRHPAMVNLFLDRPIPEPILADAFAVAAEGADAEPIALLAPKLAVPRASATVALHAFVQRSYGKPGDLPALAALLALKPDLAARDGPGQTVVHMTVGNDTLPVLTALLRAGADPNARGHCHALPDDPDLTPLACAATRGTSDGLASVNALIAAHADLRATGPDGATPLMRAAGNGDAVIAAALLKAGANPKARDAKGRTALDRARKADYNYPKATIALISRA